MLINTRCQCWTYEENNLVLWNERNCNETVRIGVRKELFDNYDVQGQGRLVHRERSTQSVSCGLAQKSVMQDSNLHTNLDLTLHNKHYVKKEVRK